MGGGQHEGTFKAAAQATRSRIRRDRAGAPKPLAKVFTVVASKLFQPSLDANKAWRVAGIRDCAKRVRFTRSTGVSLSRYIAAARIEVADVLMAATDLDLGTLSMKVGFDYYPTFAETYQRVKGQKPSDVARPHLPTRPIVDDQTPLAAARGLLDDDAVIHYVEDLLRIYPSAAGRIREGLTTAAAEPQIRVDGARCEELQAQGLWQMIRDLPFAEQCQQVRRYLFCSEVFFDLLRKRSRREGRKSRQRGVELANLALVSLETSDQVFGDRIHDLRALGWAWVGNAHRLALDFSAAATAFEQADREWAKPRDKLDLTVLAHICALKGTLWMMRREYDAATRELDRSCSLYRQAGQARDEARELITRATIHGYAGNLGESVEDLLEAVTLIAENEDRELAFAARGNLANALVRAGQTESGMKELERAQHLNLAIGNPFGTPHLDSIAGLICEQQGDLETAKRFYLDAVKGFREVDEPIYCCVVSVDLMIVHSLQDEWEQVRELAAGTLPVLDCLRLHTETIAAIGLLAQALEAERLSRRLLENLRMALRRDPLAM